MATAVDDLDPVFRALADPTRRRMLDALFTRDGQSASALVALVPEMSRFGVAKHLGILEEAGLVTTRRQGRTKLHYLNPVPIGLVADRWISKYAEPFTRAMVGLKKGLEARGRSRQAADGRHDDRPAPVRGLHPGHPEEVFAAITDPAMTRQYFHGTAFVSPPAQGEAYSTTTSDGRPAVEGTIEVLDPPRRLVQTWHVLYDTALAAEPVSRVEWEVEAAGEGLTRLRVVHGDLAQSPLTWANVRHGWVWVLDGLKSLLETGRPLPPATGERADTEDAEDVDAGWHRQQAAEANNSVWELLEKPRRSAAEDEEMLQRAYASRYHWARATGRGPANLARGAWLLARVQADLGEGGLALRYADECLAVTEEQGYEGVELAYAHEARARALARLGREDDASAARSAALAVPVDDVEDRARLERDLSGLP